LGPEVTISSSVYLCASSFEATIYIPLCPQVPLRHEETSFTAVIEGPALSPKNDDQEALPFSPSESTTTRSSHSEGTSTERAPETCLIKV
jgi:hypothetical protein